eukprot:TRINITY_DN61432_c0_g1_i1.p2 TRINITY_DN61432_c0_g1~~TRINITY_DN61432_c0_g1_i1.p2  ORF type:complete len:173 (-),score=94.82 TRINITY_DN61432_c0_g1_i1:11-490(-)
MSLINVENVKVLNNPCKFGEEFKFLITFDCIAPGVTQPLEWKLTFVGSADSDKFDQVLESVLVGPVRVGKNQFIFTAPAPNPNRIPASELLGVTVMLLTCSYREKEFIRVGYYVNNWYSDPALQEAPPAEPTPEMISTLCRSVLADKPRVTRFAIDWNC